MSTQPLPPKLAISAPGKPERTVDLTRAFSIGRGKANDLVLQDTRASRGHALLRPFSRGSYFLVDLGSANGTFLNGRLVTIPMELKHGDTIEIADHAMIFLAPAAPGKLDDTDALETLRDMSTEAVSVLVADIRGFTRLTEAVPSKELSGFIGSWFKDASATIESHGGIIDKYIGDAVMAYWIGGRKSPAGALARGPLASAMELIETATLYHGQLSARHPGLSFAVGCGIHMGQATLVAVGRSARRDFTPMGDCVNIAFRLQSVSKELARSVVVSEEIKAAAGGAYEYEDLGPQKLKGKAAELRVYAARVLPGERVH